MTLCSDGDSFALAVMTGLDEIAIEGHLGDRPVADNVESPEQNVALPLGEGLVLSDCR